MSKQYIALLVLAVIAICSFAVWDTRRMKFKSACAYVRNQMSPELKSFLRVWYHWTQVGAPDDPRFKRGAGLCLNAQKYASATGAINKRFELGYLLEKQYGDNYQYPFNDSIADYASETVDETCHLNKKRLRWVHEVLYGAS